MKSGFFIKSGGFYPAPLSRESGAGFTLIELLIVMSILALIAVIGTSDYLETRNKKLLGSAVERTVADINATIERSRAQEGGKQWGIHFENTAVGNDFYEVWNGTDYATGTKVSKTAYDPSLSFSDPIAGAVKDFCFAKATGLPIICSTEQPLQNGSIVLISRFRNANGSIFVNAASRVSYQIKYGVTGYWSLNEDSGIIANDYSSNGNAGSITGTTIVDGKIGKARNFNGTGNYITMSNPANLDTSSAVTLEAWVYPNAWDNIKGNAIITKGGNDVAGIWNLYYGTTATGFRFNWKNNPQKSISQSIPSTSLNKWYHVVGAYDGSKIYLYVNGGVFKGSISATNGSVAVTGNGTSFTTELAADDFIIISNQTAEILSVNSDTSLTLKAAYQGSNYTGLAYKFNAKTIDGSIASDNEPIRIGRQFLSGNYLYWNGIIDEVRIYNRALSAKEILNDYNENK